MSFTVEDFRDLLGILQQHPEWRTELRRWVLSEDLLALPQTVSDLARQLSDLTRRVTQLAEQMERLVEVQTRMSSDLERLKGSDLERRYRERAAAYFGRLVRKAHALSHEELAALLEDAVAQGRLSDDQADQVLEVDLVVRGRQRDTQQELYLVVGVSWGVGIEDVERAFERAALLTRTGAPAVPVVAGSWVTHDARAVASDKKVWQITDGRVLPADAT
jgi:hypothetical protein